MTQTANTARRLVDTLVMNGVERIFCVPGESYLAVLDALADVTDQIQVITCRHEAGAANMAEAYGKLTGKPGICMVTRGPGATHASIGVHTAHQDSTPMILFVGQIAVPDRGRGAFQEVDYREVFGGLAKWATELETSTRTVEVIERAFATALQGRMGPVVIALPEDVLEADGGPAPVRPVSPARSALDPAFVAEVGSHLAKAGKPLLVLGGSGWTREATTAIGDWAERIGLPLALSFRRKDLISNARPNYVGDLGLGPNPVLLQRVRDADLIITIGARLGENPTQGYTLLDRARTPETLIHIHPGPEELGRVWPPLMSACADVSLAAMALSEIEPGRTWHDQAEGGHAAYEAFTTPVTVTGAANMSECMAHLRAVLPPEAILTNGAGNYAAWLHRFHKHTAMHTQLGPTSGAMGYGYPAAVAAKSAVSRSRRRLHRRRRRISDDRAGAGHGGPVRHQHRHRHRRQRDLRHHPHASGARLSAPGHRHGPQESRLRPVRPGLRRLRDPLRDDQRLPRRLRRRARLGATSGSGAFPPSFT
jgi:acetolactate synthase-1/2/3 large subunit